MKNLKLLILATLLNTFNQAHAYYSNDSYEGIVTFTGVTRIDDHLTPADTLTYIDQSLVWLAGPLQAAPKISGPKYDAQISILEKFRDSNTGLLLVRYQYTGTFVLENSLKNSVTVRLPYDPANVYTKSTNNCFGHEKYEPSDSLRYAYFWNPVRRGCNLVEGVDYFTVQATVSAKANTQNTFPAYERLINSNGEIRAVVIFGADQDVKGQRSPDNNDDYNAGGYKDTRNFLRSQGFTSQIFPQSVREQECGGVSLAAAPGYVEEYTRQDRGNRVVIRLFWGVANLGQESSAYYCMVKEAVEKGSLLLYSGHSRVGGLQLSDISHFIGQPIIPNKNQYQIYAFFGCSSYGYYNVSYFKAKSSSSDPTGSYNLDILTNGIAGSFYAMGDYNIKTLIPILNWSQHGTKTSWQQIISSYKEAFLTGVNGDEQ